MRSYRLATTDTEAPGARVSSTIPRFCSLVHLRRPRRPIAHQPDLGVHQFLSGHHHPKTSPSTRRHPLRTGGPGRTLTVLEPQPRVHLHGKGDKWRTCTLWPETARLLRDLLAVRSSHAPDDPVFISRHGGALTRFGIYKLVRRHAACLSAAPGGSRSRRVSPHVLRHTTAVHLLEAGVEVNVIRGWLGHVSLDTTNRYADINIRSKEAALRACAPPTTTSAAFPRRPVWRDDTALLDWLASL